MRAARRGLSDLTRAERLENRRPAVVHADDHRGRSAFLRQTSDDGRGSAEAKAETADLGRADSAEETCGREGFYAPFRKRTLSIDSRGVRPDDVGTYLFEC
jgi:hypothetical protein